MPQAAPIATSREHGYTIRESGVTDINDITTAAIRFFAESDMDGVLTVNPDNYVRLLHGSLGQPNVKSFHARDYDGNVVGYIHVYYQNDYTTERVGELFQFFVAPEARGTGLARDLVARATEQFRAWGCVRAYVEVSSGFKDNGQNNKKFSNLWQKFGFKEQGIVLTLDVDGERNGI